MTKTEGQCMWDNAANPAEETAALYVLVQELRTDLAQEQQLNAVNTATVAGLKGAFDALSRALRRHEPAPIYDLLIKNSGVVVEGPDPPVGGPTPEGGSRADKPLYQAIEVDRWGHRVNEADKPLFGYAGLHGEPCNMCGEPASEHGCPEEASRG